MGMFCYQCQETAKGTGCEISGVCGKNETVAKLQDLLIYTVKGFAILVRERKLNSRDLGTKNHEILEALFMTITNANFDPFAIETKINQLITLRDKIREGTTIPSLHDAGSFSVTTQMSMLEKALSVGVLSTHNEDIRSLRQIVVLGLKGISAYTHHAIHIGKEDFELYDFIYEALAATLDDQLTVNDLVSLVMKTGEQGVKAMALLDSANTSRYGHPQITEVKLGVRQNPAILITGHDMVDLEQLLEQTKGEGVDVYTHGEMLPAHYYPFFNKYPHLVGNYGGSWWKQLTEFESFGGAILFTTNCIVPPRNEAVKARIFTTGSCGYPGCAHIEPDSKGIKDFSPLITMAKTLPPPTELESGSLVGGFAHNQVIALADKIIAAVKSGAIKKFFVMAGCDGRMKSREYYTEFAINLPKDTIILTAGCAKYRYNKLPLGDIGGIPRVLDAGQCNDSYSLAVIALKLKEVLGLKDINELPIAFNIAWYEQKAVIVLLALLSLGFKNIHLGPTLPGFMSPNVAKVLVETFGIAGISSVDQDIASWMSLSSNSLDL
jgi:hydroxylamine reductase